jgi:hypothetical protein
VNPPATRVEERVKQTRYNRNSRAMGTDLLRARSTGMGKDRGEARWEAGVERSRSTSGGKRRIEDMDSCVRRDSVSNVAVKLPVAWSDSPI